MSLIHPRPISCLTAATKSASIEPHRLWPTELSISTGQQHHSCRTSLKKLFCLLPGAQTFAHCSSQAEFHAFLHTTKGQFWSLFCKPQIFLSPSFLVAEEEILCEMDAWQHRPRQGTTAEVVEEVFTALHGKLLL